MEVSGGVGAQRPSAQPKSRDGGLRSKPEAAKPRKAPERREPRSAAQGPYGGANGFGYFGQDQSNPP
ncbi:hypothetical protein KNHN1_28250 [Pseudomonas guariconensis]